MRFDTKIAIAVHEDLAVWQKLNVTAFLTSAIVGAHPALIGEPYRDASGNPYLAMSRQPILVFAGSGDALKAAHRRALERNERIALYTRELFATGHDEANRAAFAAVAGDALDLVLVDKADSFVFGFSKLDVMFGRQMPADVRHPYRDLVKPGVRFLQSTVRSIDPVGRRVETDGGTFDADILVVALGADMDPAATPGLVEGGNEFYSVAGAETLRDVLPTFERGAAIVGAIIVFV